MTVGKKKKKKEKICSKRNITDQIDGRTTYTSMKQVENNQVVDELGCRRRRKRKRKKRGKATYITRSQRQCLRTVEALMGMGSKEKEKGRKKKRMK